MSFGLHRFANGGEAGPDRWSEARSVPQSFSTCQAVTAIRRGGRSRWCRRSMAKRPTNPGGGIAQAWSAAKGLRTWVEVSMMKPQEQR